MSLHILKTSMKLPLPREEVFAFFSDAANLQCITPPELHFQILTPQPIPNEEGTTIDYRLRLLGVPLRWQARIMDRFYGGEESTIIEDTVHYRLPFAPFSDMFHALVRLQLNRIFRFRQSAVRSYLLGVVD